MGLVTRSSVYVRTLAKNGAGVIVEAANGMATGPPFVRFNLTNKAAKDCHIGKHYTIVVEDDD